MQERSEGGLAMENNKKSLDEIYREVETDLKKGSFYTLSDEMSGFFEKNHYFKKSDFDIQDFSVEIFRYFINEGVIVIHEDN